MATITRDIRIAAPAEVVRRHLVDPARRRTWLGEDVDAEQTPDGVEYERRDDPPSRVRIAVTGDGDGARVTVTEEVDLPAARPEPPTAMLAQAA